MNNQDRIKWQKLGANCRAMGGTEFDCPMFKRHNLPKNTGESYKEYEEKVDQWMVGFRTEDLLI